NGIDTNRDFLALDTPEARTLVELLRDTEPELLLDIHEAQYQPDGRRAAELSSPGNLNNHPELRELSWSLLTERNLPAAEQHAGFHSGFYSVRSAGNDGQMLLQAGASKHMVSMIVETLRRPTS